MEIRLGDGFYCLNPSRIIYVKYYVAPFQYENDGRYQFPPDTPKDEIEKTANERGFASNFSHCIEIKMTDGENIMFTTEDIDSYNNIKAKLDNIVGR